MPKGWNRDQTTDGRPYLGSENTIWRSDVMTGIFNRKVSETRSITNFRVLQNGRSILLSDLDDIVIMNQRRESQYHGGRYYVRGSGMSYGTGRSSGKSVGDIAFIYHGQPTIVFQKIEDPSGVARLAKAARRSMIQRLKSAEKAQANLEKELERERRLVEKSQKQLYSSAKRKPMKVVSHGSNNNVEIPTNGQSSNSEDRVCKKCGATNPEDAKFCGMCGINITSTCSRCGNLNPTGSGFCNACGSTLA